MKPSDSVCIVCYLIRLPWSPVAASTSSAENRRASSKRLAAMHADAIPEETSGTVDQDYYRTARSLSKTSHTDTAFRRKANGSLYSDVPSIKYKNLDEPACKVTLKAAAEGPRPTLPRRPTTRTWNATAKERNPLASCLTGERKGVDGMPTRAQRGAGRLRGAQSASGN